MSNSDPKTCLSETYGEFETCGLWFRPHRLEKVGDKIQGHTHFHDHAMLVDEGESIITGFYPDDTLAFKHTLKKGDVFPVQKTIRHEIEATVVPYHHFCIYPSRLPNGFIAGENTNWRGSSV